MDLPGSPYYVFERLLQEYQSGQRTQEDILDCLAIFEEYMDSFKERLLALPLGWNEASAFEGEKNTVDGAEILRQAAEQVHLWLEASGLFREYLTEPQEHLALQALELAKEAHENLAKVLGQITQQVATLQNEVG